MSRKKTEKTTNPGSALEYGRLEYIIKNDKRIFFNFYLDMQKGNNWNSHAKLIYYLKQSNANQ